MQTFALLRLTLEEFLTATISFSISSMTLVMIFFWIGTTDVIYRVEIIQHIRHCRKPDGFASFVARYVLFVAYRRILREIAGLGTRPGSKFDKFPTPTKKCDNIPSHRSLYITWFTKILHCLSYGSFSLNGVYISLPFPKKKKKKLHLIENPWNFYLPIQWVPSEVHTITFSIGTLYTPRAELAALTLRAGGLSSSKT